MDIVMKVKTIKEYLMKYVLCFMAGCSNYFDISSVWIIRLKYYKGVHSFGNFTWEIFLLFSNYFKAVNKEY